MKLLKDHYFSPSFCHILLTVQIRNPGNNAMVCHPWLTKPQDRERSFAQPNPTTVLSASLPLIAQIRSDQQQQQRSQNYFCLLFTLDPSKASFEEIAEYIYSLFQSAAFQLFQDSSHILPESSIWCSGEKHGLWSQTLSVLSPGSAPYELHDFAKCNHSVLQSSSITRG